MRCYHLQWKDNYEVLEVCSDFLTERYTHAYTLINFIQNFSEKKLRV